jgi:uncharacterized protein
MKTKVHSRSAALLPILFLFFSVQGYALDRVVDKANLLSASEKEDLASMVYRIAAAYNFDLVIVTETDIGDTSPRDYANDFFDNNGYGQDGCLFLQVTESHDFYFSTSGKGITVLNSYAYQKLKSDTVKHLVEDNSYAAFLAFVHNWDKFLSLNAKGRSYNFIYKWNIVLVLIVWIVAFVIGLIVVASWKGGMDIVMTKTQAASYSVSNSLNFAAKKDNFLHSTVSKTKLQTHSSAAAKVAASNIHLSSSGKSHGGRGGKY